MAGHYIVFEGAEGCGKSTHAKRLAASLDAVLTRETGGTEVGQRLRAVLHDTALDGIDPRTEALMTAADRAQHFAEVVLPALDAGRTVVSDRSVYSSLAYQGYGRQLDIDDVRTINDWAIRGRWPDLVLWLHVPPEETNRRMRKRDLDRFEQSGAPFFARVEAGFAELCAHDPKRWVAIDGTASKDRVHAAVKRAVAERLETL